MLKSYFPFANDADLMNVNIWKTMGSNSLKPGNIPSMQMPGDKPFVPGTQKTTFSRSLRYRVLHGYEPTHPGDISVSEGDLFHHVRDLGNGWILGYNLSTGKTGTFPASFIDPAHSVDQPEKPKRPEVENVFETFQPRKLGSDTLTAVQAKENILRYRVLHRYEPTYPGDISVSDGNLIDHVRDLGNGWILGYNISTGQTGTFPASYINPADTERDTNGSSKYRSQSKKEENIPPEGPKTVPLVPDSELKTYQPANDSNVSSFTQRLLESRANEYRCIKAVLAVIVGLVVSVVLFILLVFVYDFSFKIAGYITLGFALFIIAGLAISIKLRCLMLMIFPNLMSSKGRAVFLSLIYGLLLTGPVMNISTNAVQVSESMACATEVIYNQTRALKHQLQEPLIKIAAELEQSFRTIEATGNTIQSALEPIGFAIDSFISASSGANSALGEVAQKCRSELGRARDICENGIISAKSSCIDVLNRLDITDDIVNVFTGILGIFGKRRRKREFDRHSIHKFFIPSIQKYGITGNRTWNATSNLNSTRYKRSVLSSVCRVLDIRAVCAKFSVISTVCDPFILINTALSEAAVRVRGVLEKLRNFFAVSVNSQFSLSDRINTSQTASDIVGKVSDDIKSKTESLTSVFSIVAKLLDLTLIFLFLTSVYFLRKYLSKDSYDNIYITSEFRRYDEVRRKEGNEVVLPLRRREKRKYIVTRSPLPTLKELGTAKTGLATVLLHFIITALVIFFNYALHFILNLVREYGAVAIISSGVNFAHISVSGGGFFAKFIRVFVDELDLNVTIESDLNFTVCLPDPSHPRGSDIPVFMSLYFVLLVLVLVQAYGLRIRRKIAAFYFPEQEHARVIYLHEKIRNKRKLVLSWLKQVIISKLRGSEPKSRSTLRGMLTYRNARFGRFLNFCFPPKKGCVSCDVIASKQAKLYKCEQPSCKAVYCDECFKVMEDICLICETKREVDRRLTSYY